MIPKAEQQYYTINLNLTRDFLKWVHTHRLLDGPGEEQDELWARQTLVQQHNFGGKHGTQFSTIEDITSFDNAFNELLNRRNVPMEHKHSLLYIILFLHEDYEQQSIENNRNNHLYDYAGFLLNLIADSLHQMKMMRKNKAYKEVHDLTTNEIFFAKQSVFDSMPREELVEYLPDSKDADDIVRYLRIAFYQYELYIPEDLVISIQSNTRQLKSLTGATIPNVELPTDLKFEVFTFMVTAMLDQHKKYNTDFYQEMIKDESLFKDFTSIYQKTYKKYSISNSKSLAIVGTLVSDYLIHHKLYTSKRSIALFLFEYFALFKAIRLKKPVTFPESYDDLILFYNQNNVTNETIRNLMKDVGKI